jgi:ribosomal protein L11 methyltransferase
VVDPGRSFGTGAHPTTRLCLELLLELEAAGEGGGALTDLGSGSGVLAIAAAKLGWGPVSGYDHEPAAIEAATENARANDVDAGFATQDLRERLPSLPPTVVANMTAPVLRDIAGLLSPGATPRRLICSGLLPSELDDAAAAFSPSGLVEADRRLDGDWAALLLRSE